MKTILMVATLVVMSGLALGQTTSTTYHNPNNSGQTTVWCTGADHADCYSRDSSNDASELRGDKARYCTVDLQMGGGKKGLKNSAVWTKDGKAWRISDACEAAYIKHLLNK